MGHLKVAPTYVEARRTWRPPSGGLPARFALISNGQEENGDRGNDEQEAHRYPQQSEFVQCTLQEKGDLVPEEGSMTLVSQVSQL